MKIGSKLYYEKLTGRPILLTHEQNSPFAVKTTKEQDFLMYSELVNRNPETVDVIELEYAEHRGDFEKASDFRVDLATKEILFNFPEFAKTHEVIVREVQEENKNLKLQVEELEKKNADLSKQLTEAQLALTEMFESNV